MPACALYFFLSDALFFFAKNTYGAPMYLQVPLDHLNKTIYVLWHYPLVIELGHCGCGTGELDKDVIVLMPPDLDVDRVHV